MKHLSILLTTFIFLSTTAITPAHAAAGNPLSQFCALAAEVDPQSGSANYSIPIDVPSGRAGIQPNIALQYNSSITNGPLGVGWSLELGSIQRSNKRGVPHYDNTDTFIIRQSGSNQELVAIGNNLYRPKNEGAFMRIEFVNGSYWKVTDKNGTDYIFGETPTSQEYDPNVTTRVAKWCLNKVEDVHGNYMTISYLQDKYTDQVYPSMNQHRIYPLSIDYTGHTQSSLAPYANVSFVYAGRDDDMINFINGYYQRTEKIMKEIHVSVEGALQKKYLLGHSVSNATDRNLLTSVTLQSQDPTVPALPPLTFAYQEQKGFVLDSGWSASSSLMFAKQEFSRDSDMGIRFVDINADAYPDIIRAIESYGGNPEYREFYINDKTNNFNQDTSLVFPGAIWDFTKPQTNFDSDFGVRVADVNGDGYNDMVQRLDEQNQNNKKNEVYLYNPQTGYVRDNQWTLPLDEPIVDQTSGTEIFNGTVLADVNADGFADYVHSYDGQVGNKTFINRGVNNQPGWSLDTSWNIPDSDYVSLAGGALLVDLNGDNLPDIFHKNNGDTRVILNDGHNWPLTGQSQPWYFTLGYGSFGDGSTQVTDINGDGLNDFIVASASEKVTFINTGNGWKRDTAWDLPAEANFVNKGTKLVDINADGLLDVLIHYNGQTPKLYLNDGNGADMLKTIDNGVGGITSIVYGSSAHTNNTFMPFVIGVVKSITAQNSLGDAYTTEYAYANGLWKQDEREFRGFGYVKIKDPENNYTESHYHQDDLLKGRIERQETFDALGNRYSKTETTWSSELVEGVSDFVYLSRKDNFVFDGDGSGKRTAEEFFYEETPQLGNLTKAVQLGEVDLTSGADTGVDTRTVESFYVNNTSSNNYVASLPRLTVVKNHNNNEMRKTWFYYDNQSNTANPLKGLLTKKEDWGGAQTPTITYTYDTYGNLLSTTDPRNKTTSITYDTTYHLYPLSTQNAIAHSVVNEYYGVNGVLQDSGDGFKGLWGQLKSTTDPNDQEGMRSYDDFGRLVKTISPLDSISFPTLITEYEFFPTYAQVRTKRRVKHGEAQTIDTIGFVDGMGRTIQSKSSSGETGRFVLGGQTEFNSRGLAIKQYIPYFSTAPMNDVIAIDTSKVHSTVEYDAMGRAVKSINPDGSFASVAYDDWTTISINENGHKQESDFDAYGRLIRKREYTGADGRSIHYPISNYTLYAQTQYQYDSEGNLSKTIDAHNNETLITYDTLGRKISMDDPDMGVWSYEYDVSGNLIKQTDAKNQIINFVYDDLNRLTNKNDGGTLDVSYVYDNPLDLNSKGRLTQAVYDNGVTDFKYDQLGREIQSIKDINNIPNQVERSYGGLNELLDVTYPNGTKVFYEYDDAGQIKAISNDEGLLPKGVGTQSFLRGVEEAYPVVSEGTVVPETSGTRALASNKIPASAGMTKRTGIHTLLSKIKSTTTHIFTAWIEPYILGVGSASAQSTGDGLKAEYFNGENFETLMATRIDPVINFDWGAGAPHALLNNDAVTIRWTGKVTPKFTGWNHLYISADEGYRMWLNDILVVDQWSSTVPSTSVGTANLVADLEYNIKIEYVDHTGDASATLEWVHPYVPRELVPQEYLFSLYAPTSNQAPSVNAGGDDMITLPATAILNATVSDDGLPNPPASVTQTWSKVSGPGTVTFGNASAEDTTASFSVDGTYVLRLTADDGALSISDDVSVVVNPVASPQSWLSTDVGNALGFDGSYTESAGNITVNGAGHDIWGHDDAFHYVYQSLSGDGEIVARVSSIENTNAWAKVGVMIRESFASNSKHAFMAQTVSNGIAWQHRHTQGDRSYHTAGPNSSAPRWVRLVRSGNSFTGYESSDGTNWTQVGGVLNIVMGTDVYIGLAVTSHDAAQINTTVFDNVSGSFSNLPPVNQVPTVNAGTDATITLLASATLEGTVSDDGLPNPPASVTQTWSKVSGPGDVTFGNANAEGTTASFSVAGIYVLRLTADDGEESASAMVTITVNDNSSPQGTGTILYERFDGIPGLAISDLTSHSSYPDNPTVSSEITILEGPVDYGSEYGTRIRGYIHPPVSGDYHFSISGDDFSEVYLSTDENPSNIGASPIAHVPGWTFSREWNKYPLEQKSDSIHLVAGNKYYIEVLHKERVGGDSIAVAWESASGVPFEVIPGAYLSPFDPTPFEPTVEQPTLFVSDVKYNAVGQIERIELGNGTVTTYTYDINQRLTRIYTVDSSDVAIQDLNYTYDSVGNILSIIDNVHSADQSFVYDDLSRLTQATGQTYGTKDYVYDEIGNILEKDGRSYAYGSRNVAGQLDAGPHAVISTTLGADVRSYSYDDNGNMLTKIKDGDTTDYIYDNENRLVEVKTNAQLLARFEYDGDGGRTKKIDYSETSGETCFLAGTEILLSDGSARAIEKLQVGDEVLSFDENLGKTVSATITQVFQSETTNEYYNINDRVKVTGSHPFYTNGNWKEISTFTEGETIVNLNLEAVKIKKQEKITSANSIPVYNIEVDSTHNYFAGGYLVHNKISYGEGGGTPKETTYVGSLFETDNNRDIKHIFLGNTRVASVTGGETIYFHQDHLGGANVTTDKDGVKKELTEYTPFGSLAKCERYGSTHEIAKYYFTGKELDEGVGLYYFEARYYDADLGRFIQADTIVPSVFNPQALNRYSYVINNPINLVDPDGHGFFSKLFKAFQDSFGAFVGGVLGSTAGAFAGGVACGAGCALVGAFVGGVAGSAAGTTIQHGGSFGANLSNAFIGSLPAVVGAGVGFATGGPGGAITGAIGGMIGGNAAIALINGGSFEDAAIAGIVTAAYIVAGGAYYKSVGSKVVQKGVDIHNARQAGSVVPIGAKSKTSSNAALNLDRGSEASSKQAINIVKKGEFGLENSDFIVDGKNFSVNNLIKSAKAPDRNNLSMAGRALQKHGSRQGSSFPNLKGGQARLNLAGESFVESTLKNTTSLYKSNRLGGIDVRNQNGTGVRFRADGSFYSFLEP